MTVHVLDELTLVGAQIAVYGGQGRGPGSRHERRPAHSQQPLTQRTQPKPNFYVGRRSTRMAVPPTWPFRGV